MTLSTLLYFVRAYIVHDASHASAGKRGEFRRGERGGTAHGRDHIFFFSPLSPQSIGGLDSPSPQTHPSPSHTLFCPIN